MPSASATSSGLTERGAGIGGRLVERAKAELAAAGIDHFRLTVLVDNADAIRFYQRHGLTPVVQQMLGETH